MTVTNGHAIEWWQRGIAGQAGNDEAAPLTHGEAVAIGIVQAARFAEKRGITEEPGLAARIEADFKACGLPTDLPCPVEDLLPAIIKDKKAKKMKLAERALAAIDAFKPAIGG